MTADQISNPDGQSEASAADGQAGAGGQVEGGEAKRGRGRPTQYKPEYDAQAFKLCLLGATDVEVAEFFETSEQTINAWKHAYPSFLEALKDGKARADAEIAQSLYHRAKGYSHPEDQIIRDGSDVRIVQTTKHYPPDTAAAIIWLKNRRAAQWRDRQDVTHTVDGNLLGVLLALGAGGAAPKQVESREVIDALPEPAPELPLPTEDHEQSKEERP